jgi:hypothetical protein
MRAAPRPPRFGELDGEMVAYVPLPNGDDLIFDRADWDELQRLEISPLFSLRSNGHGSGYAHCHARLKWQGKGEYPTHEAARLVLCLGILNTERATGKRTKAEHWRVQFLNGSLDLRRKSLALVPTNTGGSKFHTLNDLRDRRHLVERGRSPNAEYAARRRSVKRPPEGEPEGEGR